MPRKIISHPFQFELLRAQKDKLRIERELKLRQHIYAFATSKLSDKERKRRFAFLIAEKQFVAQQSESSDDSELDSDSSLDVETINETSFPDQEDNFSKPIDNRGFILGLIIGIFIGLCLGLVFPNQHTYLTTPYK